MGCLLILVAWHTLAYLSALELGKITVKVRLGNTICHLLPARPVFSSAHLPCS